MFKILRAVDRAVSYTRPSWVWLGQLAVVVLGIHLAADRLDDWIFAGLQALHWPAEPIALQVAAWAAVGLELLVTVRAIGAILLTEQAPQLSWSAWKRNWCIDALALPLFWAPTALAGAWVVGMAAEDLVAPVHPTAGTIAAWTAAILVAWRLGWTGWRRVVGSLDPPKKRIQGVGWAPFLVGVSVLAVVHGLPIWGWLP